MASPSLPPKGNQKSSASRLSLSPSVVLDKRRPGDNIDITPSRKRLGEAKGPAQKGSLEPTGATTKERTGQFVLSKCKDNDKKLMVDPRGVKPVPKSLASTAARQIRMDEGRIQDTTTVHSNEGAAAKRMAERSEAFEHTSEKALLQTNEPIVKEEFVGIDESDGMSVSSANDVGVETLLTEYRSGLQTTIEVSGEDTTSQKTLSNDIRKSKREESDMAMWSSEQKPTTQSEASPQKLKKRQKSNVAGNHVIEGVFLIQPSNEKKKPCLSSLIDSRGREGNLDEGEEKPSSPPSAGNATPQIESSKEDTFQLNKATFGMSTCLPFTSSKSKSENKSDEVTPIEAQPVPTKATGTATAKAKNLRVSSSDDTDLQLLVSKSRLHRNGAESRASGGTKTETETEPSSVPASRGLNKKRKVYPSCGPGLARDQAPSTAVPSVCETVQFLKSQNLSAVLSEDPRLAADPSLSTAESANFDSHASSTIYSSVGATAPPGVNVRVGVGVLVKDPLKPGNIFCGKRKGSHGAGTLALPGGHLEMYESWENCAVREVMEEMNVLMRKVRFAHATNDIMREEGKHYVTIFMMGEIRDLHARPENMEPEKCEGWDSYSWDELQEIDKKGHPKLFGPLKKLLRDDPESVQTYLKKRLFRA